ncbi:uncharacterized protein LOC135489868 isoform X2 [Lineus longissimus]|uniref:uncharacterized protein LOC135489868 isoform X2 n=1 Tax=Lineus longissimus TaxID=88925 RepID=UPI00315C7438
MDNMDFSKFRDTGELSDIVVIVDDKEYQLHKFPLYIRSDFFKALARSPTENDNVTLTNFPGGPQVFALVADFCYNIKVDITTENVVYLRCAAEFLQMTGKGNLAEISDRYLHDVLTSARLSRSPVGVVDLLLHCCKLGRVADNAKIVQRCIDAVVHIWLKPPTKFLTPRSKQESNGNDDTHMDKFSKLPLDLFRQLILAGKERVVWPKTLALAVVRYIGKHMFPEDNEKCCQTPRDDETESEDGDSSVSGDEEEKCGGTPEKAETKPNLGDERMGNMLDSLLPELPNDTPLEDVTSSRWAIRSLLIADNQNCKCRPSLMKLATQIMHKFSNDEFSGLPAKLICEITEEACKNDRCIPDVVCKVIDNYMLDLARKEELALEVFLKLSMSLPSEFRPSHDLLFDVLEAILQTNKDLSPEKKEELLGVLDFGRLGEETLRRAYDCELVPATYITPAALDLCSRLRIELDSARAIIKLQEEDMKRMVHKPKPIGTPKHGWVSEPNTPRTNVRFATNGSSKYRKDDANTAVTSTLMTSSASSAVRMMNGIDEIGHQDEGQTSNRSDISRSKASDDLSLDLSKLTDFSSSGINTDDVKDVMTGLAESSPRFSSVYMKTHIAQK